MGKKESKSIRQKSELVKRKLDLTRSKQGLVNQKSDSMKQKMAKLKVWQLLFILCVLIISVVLFLGAVGGWFSNKKITLDSEYYCGEECDDEYLELSGEEYEKLIDEKKSFIVLIDQSGCKTADRIKDFMVDYARERGIKVYRMMFEQAKKTSLHEYVKYYPSVVLVSKGKVTKYLRADSSEDADEYNYYDSFKRWMEESL